MPCRFQFKQWEARETPTEKDQAVGYAFGREVAGRYPEGGRILVLQHAAFSGTDSPTPRAQINGLRKGLQSPAFTLSIKTVASTGGEMPGAT